jgi:uncharacterized protein YuzE
LLKLPSKQIWFDFDQEAGVLYVSFERPQGATDSELTEDGILMRYRGDQLAGVTILSARKRIASGVCGEPERGKRSSSRAWSRRASSAGFAGAIELSGGGSEGG